MKIADRFWQKIPLFGYIDKNVFQELDFSGFVLPFGTIEALRAELEAKLSHFVVSYKAEVCNLEIPLEAHLCARIKGAELTLEQLKLLRTYEKRSKPRGVTFVVYH